MFRDYIEGNLLLDLRVEERREGAMKSMVIWVEGTPNLDDLFRSISRDRVSEVGVVSDKSEAGA